MPDTPPRRGEASAPESIGAMLAGLRLSRGISQLRLAELLCAASGTPTVTRHEISRWEREERTPGSFWLGWLAVVLEIPLPVLEAAVAAGRPLPAPAGRNLVADPYHLRQAPSTAELLATMDDADPGDMPALAHAWLVTPSEPGDRSALRGATTGAGTPQVDVDSLRRMDDLVGGSDLAPRVAAQLRFTITGLRRGAHTRSELRLVAATAQLTGWVRADAGDLRRALGAYRVALRAAAAGGDRPLAAHVLGSVSHLQLATGHVRDALLLARTAHAGVRGRASARQQAMLRHREALAAARAGERRAAQAALAAAERAGERVRPDREPAWLYWLDEAELAAMTGRCLATLGRPMRAAPLLATARPRTGPRTAALDASWLARAYLDLGEVEQACELAAASWRHVVRSGSARVAGLLRDLHPRLVRYRDLPAVRGYEQLAANMAGYLPIAPDASRQRAAVR